MSHLFVYETLSGGGLGAEADSPAARELLPMGVAMRDAIVEDLLALSGLRLSVATCAAAPLRPAWTAASSGRCLAVQAGPGESATDFIARMAHQHDGAWVVAPESDGLLAAAARAVAPGRWIGSRAETIALASSKTATLARMADAGLLTPLAFETDTRVRRWVIKPDQGAGAQDTWVVANREEAQARADARRAHGESVALQAWVEGEALSLTLLCRDGAVELLSINRQQVPVAANGAVSFEGVAPVSWPAEDPRRAALAGWVQQMAGALPGLRGINGVDLVWHAQRGPVLIEVNPRVSCAYVGLSQRLGRRLAAEVLDCCGIAQERTHA